MRVLEKQHTSKFDMERWKNLRAEGKINLKDGRVSLPREWTNHFYKVIKQRNKYCVIIFSRHILPKKGNILMTGYIRCKFPECNIKEKIILQKNGEVETIYEGNIVNLDRGTNASFFSRQIQGLKRKSVVRDIIHEKYPSKTWHEKLNNVPEESFEAGNITKAGCSKASSKTIKSEQVAKSHPDKDLVHSISKLKEKYNSEMGSTVKDFIQYSSVEPFTIGLWT